MNDFLKRDHHSLNFNHTHHGEIRNMSIESKLKTIIPIWRNRVRELLEQSQDVKVGEVTIGQIYGGMRGIHSLVTDISYVDPNEGIRLRGYSIPDLLNSLPKVMGASIPLVSGLYYLLLTGEIPTMQDALEIEAEWKERSTVPDYVFEILRVMSDKATPMNMFSTAILSMESSSVFSRQFNEGIHKEEYWRPMLEDSLNLTAKLPIIAAYIYNLKHSDDSIPQLNKNEDWAGNFAEMVKIQDNNYKDLTRLYFIIHSDHESGNVSAHTTHLVGSALSNIYYAASAGMNGLAGPLHGRANQENLQWLKQIIERFGNVPSKEELTQFTWDTLKSNRVIPGYGHAVLRKTDPRYTALYEFGKQRFKNDPVFDLATLLYEVVPEVLTKQGKAKNPYPNLDAISGAVQYHYGIDDCVGNEGCGFYTVLFGVSRLLGVTANTVWARAIGQPLERPKSLTTNMLEDIAKMG
jgi:citrate synthase